MNSWLPLILALSALGAVASAVTVGVSLYYGRKDAREARAAIKEAHDGARRDAQSAYEVALCQMAEVTKNMRFAAGLRDGVNPHVLDPVTFGPTGMARADEERMRKSHAQSVDEEDEALRAAEDHYFRTHGLAAELGTGPEELGGLRQQRPS